MCLSHALSLFLMILHGIFASCFFVCVLLSILVGVFAMRDFCVAENCECV